MIAALKPIYMNISEIIILKELKLSSLCPFDKVSECENLHDELEGLQLEWVSNFGLNLWGANKCEEISWPHRSWRFVINLKWNDDENLRIWN